MTDVLTPIDRYLAEQQASTAVDRFARRHEFDGRADADAPDPRWYADRLPLAAPGAGEQYAFRVDLDLCTGCKSCVAACHSLNGLDDGESWRSVGLLIGAPESTTTRQQHVPSGCHHCVDPACLSGCPTNAYEKDPFSGIVRHLDDQCFGCGYCELTCPYEVPKMNHRLGVVRKCDMCADRLDVGEAPACVQGCPTSAITITVVDTATVVAESADTTLVPGAPASKATVPTTQYVSRSPLPATMASADQHALHLSEAHPPLAFMLVLTQTSVGAFAAAAVAGGSSLVSTAVALVVGMVALGGAFLHLGRPLVAWRAVLGFTHSWFSREVVAFSGYVGIATAAVGTRLADLDNLSGALTALALAAGLAGVGCSAQIYVVTRRTWWQPRFAMTKFFATTVAAGSGLYSVCQLATGAQSLVTPACVTVALVGGVKLIDELRIVRGVGVDPTSDLTRTGVLLRDRARGLTQLRVGSGAVGIAGFALLAASTPDGLGALLLGIVALVAFVVGELVERYQFFIASVAPRMPGGFRR